MAHARRGGRLSIVGADRGIGPFEAEVLRTLAEIGRPA